MCQRRGGIFPTKCPLLIAAKKSGWKKVVKSEPRPRRTSFFSPPPPPSPPPLPPPPPPLSLSLSLSLSLHQAYPIWSPFLFTLPHDYSPSLITLHLVMSHHVSPCCIVSHHFSLCFIMSHHVAPCLTISHPLPSSAFPNPFPQHNVNYVIR